MRQPWLWISDAAIGRKISCPVAELAVSMPITRPRRCSNQRLATVAPSTSAVNPEPTPSTRPHSTTSCHSAVMRVASTMPVAISSSALQMIRRRP